MTLPKDELKAARVYLQYLNGGNFATLPTPEEMPDLEAQLRGVDGVDMLRLVHKLGEMGGIGLRVL